LRTDEELCGQALIFVKGRPLLNTLEAKHILFRGREDKLNIIATIFRPDLAGHVLDVGCDQRYLQRFINGRYVGIDISGKPDVVVNVENGIPFADRSFDTVVAMDSLEHVENVHSAFDNVCRVSKKFIIIGLPNMYEWRFRLYFLLGKTISGKYGLPLERPLDRHRWLFSLKDAKDFVNYSGKLNGFFVADEMLAYYRYRKLVAKGLTSIGRVICPKGSNFSAYHYLAVLERGN
jgi:SAM-dependent methyltransferase